MEVNTNNREALLIKEKKSTIDKIRKKYKNENLSAETSLKIATLDVVGKTLKAATIGVGIITCIDLFTPDPILFLDEAGLTAVTGLLGYAGKIVDNQIESYINQDQSDLKMEDVTKLAQQASSIYHKVQENKKAKLNQSNIK